MKMIINPGYRKLYGEFDKDEFDNLISDIPTINVIEMLAWMQAQVHQQPESEEIQLKTLEALAQNFPLDDKKLIEDFIVKYQGEGSSFGLFCNYSALLMLQKVMTTHNELPRLEALSPEQELRFYKALLICNQEWLDKQEQNFDGNKPQDHRELTKKLLPAQIPYQEINAAKLFYIQAIKAILFFRFAEQNDHFKGFVQVFLNHYELESWQTYLIRILELYVRKIETMQVPSILEVPDDHPEVREFMEQLCIDPANFNSNDDFLGIREKPLYKISEGKYCFMNLNFFVDKLYQGIKFEFANVLIAEKAEYKGKAIKGIPQFLGIYGDEFSEKGLLYELVDLLFEKYDYVRFSGEEMKAFIGEGEPDYYIRDKKKVYIIEFKDVTLGADVKHSHSFEGVSEGIYRKLVSDKKGKNEGVYQLVEQINKLRAGEFKVFDDYDTDDAIIFPIIIYTDFNFGLAGVNMLLNQKFRERLSSENVQGQANIKNVTLINLDDIIRFQDPIRQKKVKVNHCLNEYNKLSSKGMYERVTSFDMFAHNLVADQNLVDGPPKLFLEEILALITEK